MPLTTDWYWVRHGPTHAKALIGWTDLPADLSDQDQIARLDAWLPRDAALVSSDLRRAVATADAIGGGRMRLPHNRDLREFHFGAWEGRHFSDVSAQNPDLARAYWERPGDVCAPGGESWNMAAARVNAVVDGVNGQRDKIIAVAHFGVILTQVQRAKGCTAYDALAHSIAPLSVTHLRWRQGVWSVQAINHLP